MYGSIEIVPPAVKTNLGGSHDFGEELDEYIVATMDRIAAGESEVGYKFSEMARNCRSCHIGSDDESIGDQRCILLNSRHRNITKLRE